MQRTLIPVVLALSAILITGAPCAADSGKALLIGISQYADPEMNDLAYADEDVKTFGSILQTFGDYRPADVNILLNENATKQKIMAAILELVKESQKNPLDHFLLMYAGHGLPANISSSKTNSFLAPHDAYLNQFFPEGSGDLLGNETFINKAWLIRQLSAMNAKNIVIILDSCYSGAKDFGELYADNLGFKTEFETGAGAGKRGIKVVRKKGGDATLDRRIAFLASSRENQPSAEYQELRHGALSYTMFKYLDDVRGATDVGDTKEVSVDGMFTGINSLFDSVQVHGGSLSKVHQPVLVPIPDYDGVKDMRFVSMRGGKAKAVLIAVADVPSAPAAPAAPAPPPAAPKTGELYLDTGSDDCEVQIDGDPSRRRSNAAMELGEGKHLVSVYLAKTNYNRTLTVDVKADSHETVSVPVRGQLAVESRPGAFGQNALPLEVYLDGEHVGTTGLKLKNIMAGTHTLNVVAAGVSKSRQIEIRPDSPLLVRYKIIRQAAGPKEDESGERDVTF
jgi:hypothetical protein